MQENKYAYAQEKPPMEEASLAFKGFILKETASFEQTPQADLFRVNTLAQMLDRFDDYAAHGADAQSAIGYVQREFSGLKRRMKDAGFEEIAAGERTDSRWPALTEDEAAQYLKENSEYIHKRAIGVGLCSACCLPLMAMNAVSELWMHAADAWAMLGLCGMFGMIALGVYAIVTARKSELENRVRKKKFAITARLRSKLASLRELTNEKARRRRGRGIALLVACVLPIFLGAALDELWWTWTNDAFTILGVGGMFAMIGAGVYELIVAGGEKAGIAKLLKE